jgi:hypothetical protein
MDTGDAIRLPGASSTTLASMTIARRCMVIDRTPGEGAVRISCTVDQHLVTRVYYFMTEEEAIASFKEEFNACS